MIDRDKEAGVAEDYRASVITSYSIHYTKLYEILATNLRKPITYFAVLFSADGDAALERLLERAMGELARPTDIGTSHRFFFADLMERNSSGQADLVEAARHSFSYNFV